MNYKTLIDKMISEKYAAVARLIAKQTPPLEVMAFEAACDKMIAIARADYQRSKEYAEAKSIPSK
jgi:hypothetical protein